MPELATAPITAAPHNGQPVQDMPPGDDPSEAPTEVMRPRLQRSPRRAPSPAPAPAPEEEASPELSAESAPSAPPDAPADPPYSPEVDPEVDPELAKKLQIKVIDVSHGVASGAVDHAEAHIAEQTTQRGVRGFLKRVWHGNVARDFIRQRTIQHGREEIIESGNIYALQDGSATDHDQAMAAVVTRFTDDYLHGSERQDKLSDAESGAQLERELRTLVNFYAQGSIDADVLTEEKNRVLDHYREQLHAEDRNKGLLLTDNLLEVAQEAKAAFNHGVAMERIQGALSAAKGEALIGARTEARRDLTDRIVDKVHSSRVGSLVNETTIGLVTGAIITATKFTTRKAVTAAAATVGMGVGAGIVAGAREHARVGQERAQHARERATGQELEPGQGGRRAAMEETRYETVQASDVIDQLAAARQAVGSAEPAGIEQAIRSITEAQTRIALSDETSIDLIAFSSPTSVESERLQLDIKLAEAKVAVNQALAGADATALSNAGLDPDLETTLTGRIDGLRDVIDQDISSKDAVFNKLRRNRTLKMAGIGLVSGIAIGEAMQETHALVSGELQGVFEDSNGSERRTLLAGLLGHQGAAGDVSQDADTGHASAELNKQERALGLPEGSLGHDDAAGDIEQNTGGQTAKLSEHAALGLPEGFRLSDGAQGQQDLIDPEGKVVLQDIAVDGQGHLTPDSQEALREAGFTFDEQTENFTSSHVTREQVQRSSHEYLQHHREEFTKVHRELWYDNNTPDTFDQNELRLNWGGTNSTGVDEHGNYVFNMQQMTPDGSFHNGLSADAQNLLKEGKLAIALSMTQDTQTHVVMIPVDEHGNAVIRADSWMAKSLFETKDGQAQFNGAYAEAVQLMGKHNGVESTRMLATVVGEGQPRQITDTVSHVVHERDQRIITTLHESDRPVEVPPVLPIYSRRGLEALQRPQPELLYVGGPGYIEDGYRATEGLLPRAGLAPFAPELQADPDAEIDADRAAHRYVRAMRPSHQRTVERLRQGLESQPQAPHPKAVVMIPAAAHQEGRNIYNTLVQYSLQQDVTPDDFEVVVFANRPKGTRPDSTVDEVKRFQTEHPELKVRLIEKELEPQEAKIGWIRKAVTDTVITDLMERGVSLKEVMLVSNDADSEWISPKYLRTIIDKAEASPESDGFLGFIDWSYDAYKAHPEMLVATRFMQMLEIYLRVAKHEIGSSGANFAFRPAAYTAIGGYQPGTELGEDVVLGRMIKSVRAGASGRRPIAFMGRRSEVNTSARRALEKLFKDGGAPAAQWEEEFGANDELRDRDFDLQDFNFDDPAAVAAMVRSCERMLNQTLKMYSASLQDDNARPRYRNGRLTVFDNETIRQVNRMAFFLGVDIAWQPDGTMQITDAAKLIDGLKEWQSKH